MVELEQHVELLLEQSTCLSPASPLGSRCGQGKQGNVLALPVLQVCSLGLLHLEKMCARIASPSGGRS